ncbi:MAG: hypothetical protein C4530_04860 [Desulfobacteraceae bacterium]|nr:MAG: hypothetical protein C4530_04860 [Desulfobacteraceae bacterium]
MPKALLPLLVSVAALLSIALSQPAGALTEDELNNVEVYRNAAPGVVNIISVVVAHDYFHFALPQEGTGTGAIIDEKGYILTNHHVVQNAKRLEVTLVDGSKLPAEQVGSDPENDLAVIKIEPGDRKLTVIPMGSSKDLKIGQKTLAIGNPFGIGLTLTTGVISSLNRGIRSESGSVIENVIQTDAAINPGNSGGPLLNSNGEIIGINMAILGLTGGSIGVGFAIPIDTVKAAIPQMTSGKFYDYVNRAVPPFLIILLLYLIFNLVRRRLFVRDASR